jgi:hypothetical protein
MTTYVTKIQSNGKIKRGPVVSVAERKYSAPISDELLSLFDTARLVVDDFDHNYTVYYAGRSIGVVWGPSVEDEWFVRPVGQDARRVPTRDGALVVLVDEALTAAKTAGGAA